MSMFISGKIHKIHFGAVLNTDHYSCLLSTILQTVAGVIVEDSVLISNKQKCPRIYLAYDFRSRQRIVVVADKVGSARKCQQRWAWTRALVACLCVTFSLVPPVNRHEMCPFILTQTNHNEFPQTSRSTRGAYFQKHLSMLAWVCRGSSFGWL